MGQGGRREKLLAGEGAGVWVASGEALAKEERLQEPCRIGRCSPDLIGWAALQTQEELVCIPERVEPQDVLGEGTLTQRGWPAGCEGRRPGEVLGCSPRPALGSL